MTRKEKEKILNMTFEEAEKEGIKTKDILFACGLSRRFGEMGKRLKNIERSLDRLEGERVKKN